MSVLLLVGGSRGIGGAAARHLVAAGHDVLSVSRTPAQAGRWVQADISTADGLAIVTHRVGQAVGSGALDGLLFLGGVWEDGAFSDEYAFDASSPDETRSVLAINLTAPILLAQSLAPYLARAANPRIILNGSTSGLPNLGGPEVANTASKFGLQGVGEALNLTLRGQGIGVSVVNFANVATPEVLEDMADGRFGPQVPIPIADIMATYDYILGLSAASIPQSVDIRQKTPAT